MGIARIAVLLDPFPRPARPGVVGDEGKDVGTAPTGEIVAELSGAELSVIDDVVGEPALIEGDVERAWRYRGPLPA